MIISARIKNEIQYEYLRKEGVNISRLVDKAINKAYKDCLLVEESILMLNL